MFGHRLGREFHADIAGESVDNMPTGTSHSADRNIDRIFELAWQFNYGNVWVVLRTQSKVWDAEL